MSFFVRRATRLAQIQSQSASITQRRGLTSAACDHGAAKVSFWEQPMNPRNWKEEHFVLIWLSGWGLLFYSGYKLFTGDKKEQPVNANATQ